ANAEFQKVAKFAAEEKKAIDSANPNDSTLPKSPYVGVQYAAIPEFQAIGIAVGQQMSAALSGKVTVDAALKTSQTSADPAMAKPAYSKYPAGSVGAPLPRLRPRPPRLRPLARGRPAGGPGAARRRPTRPTTMSRFVPRVLMAPAVVTLFLW